MKKTVTLHVGSQKNTYTESASLSDIAAIQEAIRKRGQNPELISISLISSVATGRGYQMNFNKSGTVYGTAIVRDYP